MLKGGVSKGASLLFLDFGGFVMAYCGIMRVEKRGRSAITGLEAEANRKEEDHKLKGRDFPRSDIDWDLTNDNIFLVKTEGWQQAITKQIKEAEVRERKNSTIMIDAFYGASGEWFENHSKEQWLEYFNQCLEFHIKEYCLGDRKRLLNAVIHLDEKTPHMQVASVPIFEDEKGFHLSARDILGGRGNFRKRQDKFYDEVSKKWGLERGEIRDWQDIKKHTTKREWQIAKLEQEKENLEADFQTEKKELERYKNILSEPIEEIKILEEIEAQEAKTIRGIEIKSAKPAKVVLKREDYESLFWANDANKRVELIETIQRLNEVEKEARQAKYELAIVKEELARTKEELSVARENNYNLFQENKTILDNYAEVISFSSLFSDEFAEMRKRKKKHEMEKIFEEFRERTAKIAEKDLNGREKIKINGEFIDLMQFLRDYQTECEAIGQEQNLTMSFISSQIRQKNEELEKICEELVNCVKAEFIKQEGSNYLYFEEEEIRHHYKQKMQREQELGGLEAVKKLKVEILTNIPKTLEKQIKEAKKEAITKEQTQKQRIKSKGGITW